MTQAEVAEHFVIDQSQVSRWVNNKAVPVAKSVDALGTLLGTDLQAAFDASTTHQELYVSAPITGLSDSDIAEHREAVESVVVAVESHVNSTWWPGRGIAGREDLRAPDLATEENLRVLAHCEALLYLQFAEIQRPTGALVELGIGLGRKLKTTIICLRGLHLPFMMEPSSFAAVAARSSILPEARLYVVDTVEEARNLVANNGRSLLGLN